MKNIVVFASGSGSNFQSIINAVDSGDIKGRIAGLISNKDGIGALERAKKNDIPAFVISPSDFRDESTYESELLNLLKDLHTDLIVLAGYLKKMPVSVIRAYENRILNIHPSLLPKYGGKGFYGIKVHQAVINAREEISGCSVHIVTEEYDEGPVLEVAVVSVDADDTAETLSKKVLHKEHVLYPKVISNYLNSLS